MYVTTTSFLAAFSSRLSAGPTLAHLPNSLGHFHSRIHPQLPPFSKSNQSQQQAKFCFQSRHWKAAFPPECCILLRHVHRQSELPFVGLLSNVRVGKLTPVQCAVLEACSATAPDAEEALHLFPNREPVAMHNHNRVLLLPGKLFSLHTHDTGVDRDRLDEDVQASEWWNSNLALGAAHTHIRCWAGQVYTVLSRVRSIEGLVLVYFSQSKIRAGPAALAFYEELEADLAALDSAREAEAEYQLMVAADQLRQERTAARQHSRRN